MFGIIPVQTQDLYVNPHHKFVITTKFREEFIYKILHAMPECFLRNIIFFCIRKEWGIMSRMSLFCSSPEL